MSFYQKIKIRKENNEHIIKKANLQAYLIQKHHINFTGNKKKDKRASLFVSQCKASITVEAAIAVPCFLFTVIQLLYSIDMIRLYSNLEMAMHQTGQEMAIHAYAYDKILDQDEGMLGQAGAAMFQHLYVKEQVLEKADKVYLDHSPVVNGKEGITFLKSSFMEEDIIDLVAEYKVQSMASLMGHARMPFMNRCRMRAWTGYDNTKACDSTLSEDEEYVYVTETGSAYHTNRNCTHLELSVTTASIKDLSDMRNDAGGKYYPCELCGNDNQSDMIIIARQGDRYHRSSACSGLKRTVYTIPLSETGGRTLCERCSG
ncbi:MAG: hypothetical protein PHE02_09415 [Lachnospiraceae bacterium]|nr:hypothetical protein [Lachnospiraceae bacterium]